MRTGRPTPLVVLTAEERQTLEQWARRPTTAQGLAQRARLVLACASTKTNGEIATTAGVTRQTVGRWRHRFVRKRLQGLLDEPRPGAPRKIADAEVERVIALTLERTPRDATHWSTRAMAKRSGLSQTAVSRIWRAFGLQPHRGKTFKLSKDPLFIDKVRDIANPSAAMRSWLLDRSRASYRADAYRLGKPRPGATGFGEAYRAPALLVAQS